VARSKSGSTGKIRCVDRVVTGKAPSDLCRPSEPACASTVVRPYAASGAGPDGQVRYWHNPDHVRATVDDALILIGYSRQRCDQGEG
jgi:hypothetical protein